MTGYDSNFLELIKENTAFKTDERAKAVAETLLWLEQGAPHKFDGLPGKFQFDMSSYVENETELGAKARGLELKPKNECGTACCIAGAIHMFERKGEVYPDGEPDIGIEDEFNLEDERQLSDLFLGQRLALDDITAKGAAITLRRYIETGEVVYKIEEQ